MRTDSVSCDFVVISATTTQSCSSTCSFPWAWHCTPIPYLSFMKWFPKSTLGAWIQSLMLKIISTATGYWGRGGPTNSKAPNLSQLIGNTVVSGVPPPSRFRHWLQSLCEIGSHSLKFPACPRAQFSIGWQTYTAISCESRTADGSTALRILCSLPCTCNIIYCSSDLTSPPVPIYFIRNVYGHCAFCYAQTFSRASLNWANREFGGLWFIIYSLILNFK